MVEGFLLTDFDNTPENLEKIKKIQELEAKYLSSK
jgi:hypothetical protein